MEEKIAALRKQIQDAEDLIAAETKRAEREHRPLDPKLVTAMKQLEATAGFVTALEDTLISINGLFVREEEPQQ